MIKFSAKFKVLNIENKSVQKKDGGTFNFVEVTLEEGTKKKTQLVARLGEDLHVKAGDVADMDILVTSHDYNGRIFNSFLITDVLEKFEPQPIPKVQHLDSDEIPF